MSNIAVTLPDGNQMQVEAGTTALAVAEQISPGLARAALVAKIDGELADLGTALQQDSAIRFLTDRDDEALEVYRHSAAHLLAAATLELYPETKLGVGPPTDQGFFYDMYRETPFTPDDLEKIEARMGEIVKRNLKNERVWIPRDEALAE